MSCLVIISLILMTCLFDQAVLSLGEISRWSLLGLKQLTLSHGHLTLILITTLISCSSPLFKGSSFILPYPCRLLELVLCHVVLVMVTLYSFLILVEHLWAQQHGWVLTVQAAKKKMIKNITLSYSFTYAKDLSGSVDALWCWIILKSLFSASLIAWDGVLRVHSQMSVTQHLHGLLRPLLPGDCQCMMVLLYILYLFSHDTLTPCENSKERICIGNIMSNISKLFYVISRAIRWLKFETILKYHKWYLCKISRTNHAIICLYCYTALKGFVIFRCRYFKLSWNTTALSQSNFLSRGFHNIYWPLEMKITSFCFLKP